MDDKTIVTTIMGVITFAPLTCFLFYGWFIFPKLQSSFKGEFQIRQKNDGEWYIYHKKCFIWWKLNSFYTLEDAEEQLKIFLTRNKEIYLFKKSKKGLKHIIAE